MRVYETEIPGTGVRYTLKFDRGSELIVLLRNGGERELYWRGTSDADSERLFGLDEAEARKLSDILDGTYFHPVDEGLEEVFEDAQIRWIHIDPNAPIVGQTVGDVAIRSRTGVTVLGLRRDGVIVSEVGADTRIEPNDVLVGVGSEESHAELRALLD